MTPAAVWARLQRDGCVAGHQSDRETGKDGEWAIGEDLASWSALVTARREQLEAYALEHSKQHRGEGKTILVVLVADAEPTDFLAGFWAGVLAGWTVALANPNWAKSEWQSALNQTNPSIIWSPSSTLDNLASTAEPVADLIDPIAERSQTAKQGQISVNKRIQSLEAERSRSLILIPTGGTSGQLKFACHTWATLTAAVYGFARYFQPKNTPINAYCVLPLYHVSGLMQALRTWLTGGQLAIAAFKDLLCAQPDSQSDAQSNSALLPPYTYLSLVPTQLSRLIDAEKSSWLRQFHAVLLGGAPPWPALLDRAASHRIPLCLTYGMTETGAMVSAMRSPDFSLDTAYPLTSGWPMPHATIQIEESGKPLPRGETGQVVVTSNAIAHGYYSAPSPRFKGRTLYTDDLGYLDRDGRLHITGRASSKIISGGENIFPSEVETALWRTGQVLDVCVVGLPDADWGEVVGAAYVPRHQAVSTDSLRVALDNGNQLSRYKYPKRWFALETLPKNAQGKINHLALRSRLARLTSHPTEDQ
nr:AMP-binding protein [cf. Phormidesmis sp. LEGE 11477]